MPELERYILHRMTQLDAKIRAAVESYDWTGVYPELHNFCATDLSAFYFDIRKDTVYCDAASNPRRRAARTVLDHLHRYLCTWLAPVLCFTAEEAWTARFGEQDSVHLHLFPTPPHAWRDDRLGAKWDEIRAIRRRITVPLEEARRANTIGASLQAAVTLKLAPDEALLLSPADWAELAIVSDLRVVAGEGDDPADIAAASGRKCDRCWKVLTEVGSDAAHPTLCLRCVSVVEGV